MKPHTSNPRLHRPHRRRATSSAAPSAALAVALGLLGAVIGSLNGCGGDGATNADSPALTHLRRERQRWAAQDIRSYQLRQSRDCGECPPGAGGVAYQAAWRVSVADGAVIAAEYDGVAWPDDRLDEFYSVDALFALAEQALREAAHSAITYDGKHAFPAQISIDWISDPQVADDDQQISSTDFQPL